MIFASRMTLNETDLAWTCALVYPILVVWVQLKNMASIVLSRRFCWLGRNWTEIVKGSSKVPRVGCFSIISWDLELVLTWFISQLGRMKCMIHNPVCRSSEWTSREGMWGDIIRGEREEFKKLYEGVAVVDVWFGCSYKRLHVVDDMIIILDGKGTGKGGVRYIDFGEAIEKRGTLVRGGGLG